MSIPHHSTHATQALTLFEQGVTNSEIARSLGVTPSAITQLFDSEELAPRVKEIREAQLERSASLDVRYDRIEEKLLDQLERTIPMLLKPEQITNVLSRVNAAKRRGISLTQDNKPATVVHLALPPQIMQRITTNINNQVVSVGGQQLITLQSQNVATLAKLSEVQNASQPQTVLIEQEDEYGFTTSAAR